MAQMHKSPGKNDRVAMFQEICGESGHKWHIDWATPVSVCQRCYLIELDYDRCPITSGHTPQTKLESIIEQAFNVGSGMIIAYVIMEEMLVPLLHIGMSPMQNVWVTIILTSVSVLRGYCWRRIFNKRMYKQWSNWLRGI